MRGSRHGQELANTACVLLLASALSACGSIEPRPERYILGDAPSALPGAASLSGDPVVEVDLVRVPDYLDTLDLLARGADGRIVASRSARWGERVSVGTTRAVALSLAAQLPHMAVTTSPPTQPVWRDVSIDIDNFGMEADGKCVLAGTWTARGAENDTNVDQRRFMFVEPVVKGADDEVVAVMTHEADELAAQIAGGLQAGALAPEGSPRPGGKFVDSTRFP